MVKLKIYGEEYTAYKAIKGKDFVKLYDETGICFGSFEGISDFTGYEIIEGAWSEPQKTQLEIMQETVDALVVSSLGVM